MRAKYGTGPTMSTHVCETCGTTYQREAAQARRYKHHFCSVACRQQWHRGETHASWKGGRLVHPSGYIRITLPNSAGTVWEHRWVWEQTNGPIPPGHDVHHRNRVRADNRI